MNKNLESVLSLIEESKHLTDEEKKSIAKFIIDADKELEITAFKLERTEKVKHTTAILLEETIEELEQKRKAVEEQKRNLEIETALERVRSRSLAMHKSEELQEVITTVLYQLNQLGIAMDSATMNLPSQEKQEFMVWIASKNQEYSEGFRIPFGLKSVIARDHVNILSAETDHFIQQYSKEEKDEYYRELFGYSDFRHIPQARKDFLMSSAKFGASVTVCKYSGISVLSYSGKILNSEEIEVLKRFSRVFEQAYIRFLDLQKAEAQAHEAQIENALEKVRSRSLAMHKSNELQEVITTVLYQLNELGIAMDSAVVNLLSQEKQEWMVYIASKNHDYSECFRIPFGLKSVIARDFENFLSAETDHFIQQYSKEEKDDYYQELFEYSDFRHIPQARKDFLMSSGRFGTSAALGKYSTVTALSYSGKILNSEEIEVLKRFLRVFEQAYVRFLDLQKAEKQARESQIQLALERVRARTMAMQSSEELAEVSYLLNKQIVDLGIPTWGCAFNIYNETDSTEWFSNLEGTFPTYKTPRENIFLKYYEAGQRGESLLIEEFGGERIKELYKYFALLNDSGDESINDHVANAPDYQINHMAYFKYGYLLFVTLVPAPEAHDVFRRFAKEFEQTYTRFLDLQKAEAQARESQIQLALERVRARTMAMHHSSELADTATILFQQIKELGFEIWSCGFGIWRPEVDLEEAWMSTGDLFPIIMVPFREDPTHLSIYEASQRGESVFEVEVEGEVLTRHYEWLISQPSFKIVFGQIENSGIILPTVQYKYAAFFKQGYLHLITTKPQPDIHNINQRFAKVFEQTYTRFLDLQKAETQAREAQIEVAVERVRAKALAMHKSAEIMGVAVTMRIELETLNMPGFDAATITLIQDDGTIRLWDNTSAKQHEDGTWENTEFIFRLEDNNPDFYLNKIWSSNDRYIVVEQDEHDLKITTDWVRRHDKNLADVVVHYYKENRIKQAWHPAVALTYGRLNLDFYVHAPEPEVENILIKMAAAFDLAYKRFLDLQKAEAQAREAQIEAALERVRSRTMGMQKSDELREVIQVIYEQFMHLGIDLYGAAFAMDYRESEDWHIWSADLANLSPTLLHIPYFDHPYWNTWNDAKRKGLDTLVYTMAYEEKNSFVSEFGKHIPNLPAEAFELVLGTPGYTVSNVFLKNVTLYIDRFTTEPYSDADNAIFMRFGKVFEQTYTRFKDLEKAEAQARESQIETSMERVRSRTMAMRRSEELPEVAALLFQQVKSLGVPQFHCGFNIFEIDDKECTWYPGSADGDILPPCKIPLTEHPIFMNFIESRKRGDELCVYEKEGEYQAGHYRYMLSLPVLGEILQNMLDAGIPFPTFQIDHLANFSHGNLLFITSEHFPEMHDTFKRFAKVFEQTYTRFLDLQKAEASAQEAIKQSSLDRVRGEIASMRTADDLSRITPVVWHELTALGVPFFRCGVFIIKEKEQLVHVYLSNPEGKSLAVLHLPINGVELTINAVDHWRRQQTYTAHWDREQFMAWVQTMQTQGQVQSATTYQGAESPPESLTLQFIPFNQGMLYIGSTDALNENQLSLAKDLAAAFSVAYARYEDFKTIENTLAELKATQTQLIQSEKLASLGELTAGIAHEIQNPLNFVNNFSELSVELIEELKSPLTPNGGIREGEKVDMELFDDVVQNLEKINLHGKRASSIVKGMLEHSRQSTGERTLTDINQLADEYLRLSYHGLRAKDKDFNAELITDFDENLPKIEVIPQDIGRVLLNLINNAFWAVKSVKKPLVVVKTEHTDNQIIIKVSDNGMGMTEATKAKIFQPFFTTKPTGQGTGLGLSLAYDIVTKGHGGALEVESVEGEETTFLVKLFVIK